jgi:DNA-binding NarL/FixJ family response regulator
MRELSVAEQRYKAVLAVIAEGKTVTEVARDWRVSRQTLHTAAALTARLRQRDVSVEHPEGTYRCVG